MGMASSNSEDFPYETNYISIIDIEEENKMAVIELTAAQAELAFVLVNEAFDALARYQKITEYSDEQCLVLIDETKKTRAALDERLAAHYE